MWDENDADGFRIVHDIVDGTGRQILREATGRLEQMAADRHETGDGFVLEAADVGGWAAWQRGVAPTAGVLRSVDGAHRHCPELLDVAEAVAKTQIGGSHDVINTFLWAKPAKVGSEKPWHQDMAFAPAGFHDRYRNVVTAWIAVDEATAENGCLQFVPGSHRVGVLPHIGDAEVADGAPRHTAAVEPHVDPAVLATLAAPVHAPLASGSGAVFDGYLVHRSAPNTSVAPRRAISFVYALPR
jgi:ectoine hydroxylase-related dioxygenase (phytanoyl-CoA dioxygenase family)